MAGFLLGNLYITGSHNRFYFTLQIPAILFSMDLLIIMSSCGFIHLFWSINSNAVILKVRKTVMNANPNNPCFKLPFMRGSCSFTGQKQCL